MKLVILLLSWAMAQVQFENKLIEAVNNESTKQVKQLSQDKKLLQLKDSVGHDALYHAVSINNLEIVKSLLKAGASTKELYNDKQESLLFEASRLGSVEVVSTLLKANPELLTSKNSDGETVLFEAARSSQNELAQYYVKKGLKTSDKNKSGKRAIDYAPTTNTELLKILRASK